VTVVGFVLGTVIGTLGAALLWWNKFLSAVLAPYLVVLNSLPKTALAPILIVWIGNNVRSVIVTALLISVIVSILTILNGFLHVDPEKVKLMETLCGKKSQTLFKLIIPANIPTIISAMKINVGLSLVGVIVGEFLVAQAGLGYLIIYGSQIFRMDWVMLSIIILCVMAAVLYQLIVMLEKRFAGWMT
jgi:NitT/TauT family transport system permease protein